MKQFEFSDQLIKQQCGRTKCFFDLEINNHQIGRVIFELFNDLCPKACENFRSLCTGFKSKIVQKSLN